ncbi:FAD/NAD(P)-binding protein [Maribacter flavus]|uniref:FAD-dependent urate hydroxylase HpyO/Asp monooxygenase CreE-like FAD/NAD(P)-binding domain-containing protein n=1 Tax=Maribacter flavus TaxID=1658664 RepID=A0A5B2TMY9_9FLAO|nr:FAD/NAD(P)-binding protein [Maribacter flavus]KAA2215594.1 hypothetical protein F0361_18345 [Maribacter flavus]
MATKIAFIGAGIATSYTLIPLLDNLSYQKEASLELYVVDKSNDFFKGMPYGERSGKSVLLIQDLKNFISEPQRTHFKNWLNENIDGLAQEFVEHGGHYASDWVRKNNATYTKGDWDDLYIPRFFFGRYIEQEVLQRIEKLRSKNCLSVHYIKKEIVKITRQGENFRLFFDDGTHLDVDKTVLSIGSLPYKQLYEKPILNKENALYIKEPYGVGMEENMAQIVNFVKNRNKKNLPTKIAVLGANASGLEMIYKICDKLPLEEYQTSFKTLSSHGVMPDGTVDQEKAKSFEPKHLIALSHKKTLTAKEISEAAHKDIDAAESLEIGAATSVGIISKGFGALLPRLDEGELSNFACFYGNQIGRRQRCAGNHYLSVVDELSKRNRFSHIKGRFAQLQENENGLEVSYTSTDTNSEKNLGKEDFNIVVNCLGSVNLMADDLSPFLKGLIADGLCTPNPSQIGFHIDKKMQASKNLFVAGPLLAGNQIEDKIFWHLEHCVRIIWSSNVLSKNLWASLTEKVAV